MKRVEYFLDRTMNFTEKFILEKEYKGFGIYKEKTPTGFFVHQSYLVKGNGFEIRICSFMNMCLEEILDMIDYYAENGNFGYKAMDWGNGVYVLHTQGNKII